MEYNQKLADMYSVMTSGTMIRGRLFTHTPPMLRILHVLRSLAMLEFLAAFRRMREMLKTDLHFRAFHESRSPVLPDYYRGVYRRKFGRYAALNPRRNGCPCCTSGCHADPLRGVLELRAGVGS